MRTDKPTQSDLIQDLLRNLVIIKSDDNAARPNRMMPVYSKRDGEFSNEELVNAAKEVAKLFNETSRYYTAIFLLRRGLVYTGDKVGICDKRVNLCRYLREYADTSLADYRKILKKYVGVIYLKPGQQPPVPT